MLKSVGVIRGRIPYRSRSADMGFVEELAPGCFAASLKAGGFQGDVICRQEHDSRLLLGRRSAGTLRLQDTPAALTYECDLPETTAGMDCAQSCARGDLIATSFSFVVEDPERDEDWIIEADGTLHRTIRRASILECSPVAQPAYPAATVTVERNDETVDELMARTQAESGGVPHEVNALRLRLAMS